MKIRPATTILAIVTATGIIGMVAVSSQQASAFEIKDFKKLTFAFEKNVISGVWNPGDSPPLRELVDAYGLDVMRIFLGGPDTIPGALIVYQEGIFTLFEHQPSGHKPVLNDQIQEFRQLTHAFEKAVRSAINPPDPD
jgi:hypothetical protein